MLARGSGSGSLATNWFGANLGLVGLAARARAASERARERKAKDATAGVESLGLEVGMRPATSAGWHRGSAGRAGKGGRVVISGRLLARLVGAFIEVSSVREECTGIALCTLAPLLAECTRDDMFVVSALSPLPALLRCAARGAECVHATARVMLIHGPAI